MDYASLDRYAMWDIEHKDPDVIRAVGTVEAAEEEAAGRIGAAQYNYLAALARRAEGGPVEKNKPFIVGEKGPEVFVPEKSGTIIPNKSLAPLRPKVPKNFVPAGTGPETGQWQDLGGGLMATAGPGVDADGNPIDGKGWGTFSYNRPAHHEVVGAEGGPVHVLRGLRSSYAGGAPGERWGSPQRAAQAIRRATGQEKWIPPEQEMEVLRHQNRLKEIAAQGKSQEAQLAGDMVTRKSNLETFMNRVQSDPRFYKEGPEGLTPVIPGLGQLVLGFKSLGEAEPEKAWQAFEAKALRHLDEGKWVNEQGITTAINNLQKAGYSLTPGQKNWLLSQQPEAEMEKKRRDTIIQWANPTSIPDRTSQTTSKGPGPQQVSPLSLEGNAPVLYARPGQPLLTGAGRPQSVNMAPLRPLSVPLGAGGLRPDQYSRMVEDRQREQQQETARKKQMAELSSELERRIGLQ
ncbi:MAG: hypothetical protein ACOZF2_11230 [Thermodesulfobacteriota bacterium]